MQLASSPCLRSPTPARRGSSHPHEASSAAPCSAHPCSARQQPHEAASPAGSFACRFASTSTPPRFTASSRGRCRHMHPPAALANGEAAVSAEGEVLAALSRIIDPDFGQDVVTCGFIKDLAVDRAAGRVAFRFQLTTPACPVKAEFERQARQFVGELPWVEDLQLTMDAAAPKPLAPSTERPGGLARVKHVIAVSSCKGGVGKSTTAVNLAYTLMQMGGKVGILDADVYGPSLPTMVSPETRVLIMDQETRALTPVEYEGVKVVSFGYAGQGSAIMRGAMTSGLISQLLTTADWGELDYLVIDFPPGTGDIQLTLCQTVALSAAVIVTTPQKLAYVDVVKGIRMFARLQVPCVAVVENMSYFDGDDGKRYFPLGTGSGERIQREFGLPHLVKFPMAADISASGDGGKPIVVEAPASDTASAFMELGAAVVREVAKLEAMPRNAVRFDEGVAAFAVSLPASTEARPLGDGRAADAAPLAAGAQRREFYLDPATVRCNDTSAAAIDEWTGERLSPAVEDGIRPASISPCGNYAVQILWDDGFNQVAPFELLSSLERLTPKQLRQRQLEAAMAQPPLDGLDADATSDRQLQTAEAQ